MSHWPFIIAAYALTLAGTFGVAFWSLREMRRAEGEAEALRSDRKAP